MSQPWRVRTGVIYRLCIWKRPIAGFGSHLSHHQTTVIRMRDAGTFWKTLWAHHKPFSDWLTQLVSCVAGERVAFILRRCIFWKKKSELIFCPELLKAYSLWDCWRSLEQVCVPPETLTFVVRGTADTAAVFPDEGFGITGNEWRKNTFFPHLPLYDLLCIWPLVIPFEFPFKELLPLLLT